MINYSKITKKWKSIVNKDIHNATGYKLQKIVSNKKRVVYENKLTESTGKRKEIWKASKYLGWPEKVPSCGAKALKINNTVEHGVKSILEVFQSCYST